MITTPKRALITGITGQDGSYLAEFLLAKGYTVHGVVRRSSLFNTRRIDNIYESPQSKNGKLKLHFGDMTDANVLAKLMREVRPNEVYNLAAQSHVRVSFDMPLYTADTVAMGALRLLEAVREFQQESGQAVRYYQASSSEQFGKAVEVPQKETTPFYPRSPYACSKVMAHWATINYRESYSLHASCGIMFNHESPRRGETFVTRKITRAVGRIKMGLQDKVYLGSLDPRRDWGFAGDYIKMMWLMLQQEKPGDYVIATGRCISVREFCDLAFRHAGLDYRDFVAFDARYLRPAEVDIVQGDSTKAKERLGWAPSTTVEQLAAMMVDSDMELARREKTLKEAGHNLPEYRGHDH